MRLLFVFGMEQSVSSAVDVQFQHGANVFSDGAVVGQREILKIVLQALAEMEVDFFE